MCSSWKINDAYGCYSPKARVNKPAKSCGKPTGLVGKQSENDRFPHPGWFWKRVYDAIS